MRGVRAALEARDALLALGAELAAETALRLDGRVGVSTGEVIAGGDGLPQPRATGLPLTVASRLVRAAGPGSVVVDEATLRLARDAVVAEPADDAWVVLALTDPAARPGRRLVSSMIGRTRERRRLQDAFDQAVSDSSCQLFSVLGAAGVGKSRLVHEFLRDLAGLARVARGRCLPYGEGITFWPVLEVLKEAVGARTASPRTIPMRSSPGSPRAAAEPRTTSHASRSSSRHSPEPSRWYSSSTTSTGARRPSSTSSSTSPSGRERLRSCSSAWRDRSCSRCARAGAAAS